MQHERRRVAYGVGVTDHPTDEWIKHQMRQSPPFDEKPKHLICDNDKKYGAMFEQVAKASSIEVDPHTLRGAACDYDL